MPVLDFTFCVLSKRQEGASDDLCSCHPLCLPSKRGCREVGRENAMACAVRSMAGPSLSRRGTWGGLSSWLIFCSWSTMLSLNKQFENSILWNREKYSYELLLNPGGNILESWGSQKLPHEWSWSRWGSLPSWDDQPSWPTPNPLCVEWSEMEEKFRAGGVKHLSSAP